MDERPVDRRGDPVMGREGREATSAGPLPPTHETTPRTTRPTTQGRRWGGALVGGVIGALGVGLVAAPAIAPEAGDPLLLVATGVALLTTAAAMEIGALWLPRPASAVTPEDGDGASGSGLRIRLRTQVPWSVALVGVGFTVFFVAAALTMGLGDGGLLLTPFVLLFASIFPDAVMTLLRRRSLHIDASGLRLEGWGVSAELGWADVVDVDLVTEGRRPALHVRGAGGATSWRHRRRRVVWHTEPAATGPALSVPVAALDAPGAVMVLCRELASSPPERRRSFLEHGARGLLTGHRSVG